MQDYFMRRCQMTENILFVEVGYQHHASPMPNHIPQGINIRNS
jgi:hypothetical protein